jgi:hypothetical protein
VQLCIVHMVRNPWATCPTNTAKPWLPTSDWSTLPQPKPKPNSSWSICTAMGQAISHD